MSLDTTNETKGYPTVIQAGIDIVSELPQPTFYTEGLFVGSAPSFALAAERPLLTEVSLRIEKYGEEHPDKKEITQDDTFLLGVFLQVFNRKHKAERGAEA